MDKPTCYVLIGIPCSGKSTWAEKAGIPIISCDKIRIEFSKKKGVYMYNPAIEDEVWKAFHQRLGTFTTDFIVDNTNCNRKRINTIKSKINRDFKIEYVIFEIPLWKAHLRNLIRYWKTGKWIPLKVMNMFHRNLKKLNLDQLKHDGATITKTQKTKSQI